MGKGFDVYKDSRPWATQYSLARLESRTGNTMELSGVRWGYIEEGKPADWEPIVKNTVIDMDKVTEVYVGMEPMINVGHSSLIFEFSEPIQTTDGKSQDNRLVVSVEALRKQGQPYKPWKGFGKNYGLVYQMGSFGDRVQHTARKLGRSQELRKLKLTPEQKRELLELSIEESVKDRTGDYYHVTRDSCFSGTIKQLDKVVDGEMEMWLVPKLLLKPDMVVPSLTALGFNDRGILEDEPCQIIQPDPELHPGKARSESRIDPLVAKLSKKRPRVWKTAFQAAGLAAGALIAGKLGGGIATQVAAGAVVAGVGGTLGDHLRLSAGHEYMDPREHYPSHISGETV